MDFIDKAVEGYARDRSRAEPELLQRLTDETYASMKWPGMLCGRLEGRLLKLLVQLIGAKRVLEIGMFTGYSALSMAEGLPDDGRLITCDIDPVAKAFAERYVAESEHGRKIEIRLGPALDTIATLSGPFDLVFIDADKENYVNYYQAVVPMVRSGGLIAIDNALWSGKVVAPADRETRVIDELNRLIADDQRVENVLLTIRDGLHLARKR
ncbi:MAG: class I SAM-dependent methyltransferase [Planctomycetes bacterium]|nr:class I SAM-dependent methyltransferase [Planctomycetota bacterium]